MHEHEYDDDDDLQEWISIQCEEMCPQTADLLEDPINLWEQHMQYI